jgi:hypothetical protein
MSNVGHGKIWFNGLEQSDLFLVTKAVQWAASTSQSEEVPEKNECYKF